MSYKQNALQIEQLEQSNYISFRSDLETMLKEASSEIEEIVIPEGWLFNALYPNAKHGDFNLNAEYKSFLTDDSDGLPASMDILVKTMASKNGDRYRASSYDFISRLTYWFLEIAPYDADLRIAYNAGDLFSGHHARIKRGLLRDLLLIATTINAFEGWSFFSNKERRNWVRAVERLEEIEEEATLLTEYLKWPSTAQWRMPLVKNNLKEFRDHDLLRDVPERMHKKEAFRRLIYETYTTREMKSLLSPEATIALAEALRIG
jgi:hypothetical protein